MNLVNLEKVFEREPKYRLKQARAVVFKDLIEDWQEAKTLPQELRRRLTDDCPLRIEARVFNSPDGAAKAILTLKDGLKIESVLLRHKDGRNTVCVSSQAGCPMGCQFCLTGKMGFKRNLDYSEIIEQVLFFARLLKKEKPFNTAQGKQKITNVVFMGMGEPFLNYDNALKAIKILNDKDGFNLGSRHFSISTCGIIEGIEKLAKENLQVNLAISLHAAGDELRGEIMPINPVRKTEFFGSNANSSPLRRDKGLSNGVNKKYPIKEILKAVLDYIKKTKRRVMFEYIMIDGINDSDEQARKLTQLLKDIPLSFVNLISYNPIRQAQGKPTGIFKPSPSERIKKFKEILENGRIPVTQRYRFGQDITAACGQLAMFDVKR